MQQETRKPQDAYDFKPTFLNTLQKPKVRETYSNAFTDYKKRAGNGSTNDGSDHKSQFEEGMDRRSADDLRVAGSQNSFNGRLNHLRDMNDFRHQRHETMKTQNQFDRESLSKPHESLQN